MSRRFSRWLTSKTGTRTLAAILAVVVVVAVAGAVFGWWAAILDLLRGTAGPAGGYSCLPSCVENDGMFLSMPSDGLRSFGGTPIVVWISVPEGNDSFELSVFDGDSGKDDSGNLVGWRGGNWDGTTAEATYTLYADPLKDGTGGAVVGQWFGNQQMPNNAWFDIALNNSSQARAPDGGHVYRLEISQGTQPVGLNRLKLRSTGYISTGYSDLVGANFAIVGGPQTLNDVPILFYQYGGDLYNPGPSHYKGDWQFYVYVPEESVTFEVWDGDFDRGTSAIVAADTDDPNTEGKPYWATSSARQEWAWGRGAPADDISSPILRVEPPVRYEIIDPDGLPIHVNEEPSGSEEWERFAVSTDPGVDADLHTNQLKAGMYIIHIQGLDGGNTVWLRANYCMSTDPDACKPPCEATCPRTIGYWKNNVKKVLIEGRTGGVQETRESLESALNIVAQYSPLYRSGINVAAPAPIGNAVRLTDQEADAILQKAAGNTMLDRALQQNLATWLNWASGKICSDTFVTLNVAGGPFQGSVWEALQEAQDLILNHQGDEAALERAKDIADRINNADCGEDCEEELACEDYEPIMPPGQQRPKYQNVPKAEKKPEPPDPVPQPITCDAPRVNTYNVENPTSNPFYGIKFEYQSGTEVKDGNLDEFQFIVTSGEAANMTSAQIEAKAGQDQAVATVSLECDFDGPVPCGEPIVDGNGFFAFQFMGAEDNGDGTMTLTFHVQNFTSHGLSHVTIGLPAGVVPSSPTGSYQSQVCP